MRSGREEYQKIIRSINVPVPSNEWLRLSVLRECNILDTEPCDPEFDRYTALCARTFNVPFCCIGLVDIDRVWIKSTVCFEVEEVHRNDAFCSHVVLPDSPDVMVVPDSSLDTRFQNNCVVEKKHLVTFYAGAALVVEGVKIGTLCIMDSVSNYTFNLEDKKKLLDIAAIISQLISWKRSQYLHVLKRQSQYHHILFLTHNLRTPCTSLEISIQHLDMNLRKTKLASTPNDLLAKFKQLEHLICHFSDLCHMMPSLANDPSDHNIPGANGYHCDLAHILHHMRSFMRWCVSGERTYLRVEVDEILTKSRRNASYFTFPEIIIGESLALTQMYSSLTSDIKVEIYFVDSIDIDNIDDIEKDGCSKRARRNSSDCHTAAPELNSFSGMIVFEMRLNIPHNNNDLAGIMAPSYYESYCKSKHRLSGFGGGMASKSEGGHHFIRFWLPLGITLTSFPKAGQDYSDLSFPSRRLNVLIAYSGGRPLTTLKQYLNDNNCNVFVVSSIDLALRELMRVAKDKDSKDYDFTFLSMPPSIHEVSREQWNLGDKSQCDDASGVSTIFVRLVLEGEDDDRTQRTIFSDSSALASASFGLCSGDDHRQVALNSKLTIKFQYILKHPYYPDDVADIVTNKFEKAPSALFFQDSSSSIQDPSANTAKNSLWDNAIYTLSESWKLLRKPGRIFRKERVQPIETYQSGE